MRIPAGWFERAAAWLRGVRFSVLVVLGGAYCLLDLWGAWDNAEWLRRFLIGCVFAVFGWIPGLETWSRNFRAGYRGIISE